MPVFQEIGKKLNAGNPGNAAILAACGRDARGPGIGRGRAELTDTVACTCREDSYANRERIKRKRTLGALFLTGFAANRKEAVSESKLRRPLLICMANPCPGIPRTPGNAKRLPHFFTLRQPFCKLRIFSQSYLPCAAGFAIGAAECDDSRASRNTRSSMMPAAC